MENNQTTLPHLYLYAGEGFSAFHLAIPFFVLGGMGDKKLFDLTLFGENASLSDQSGRLTLKAQTDFPELAPEDILLLPDWPSPETRPSDRLIALLQKAQAQQNLIIGLCLGAYALAYAGIADHKKLTAHWAFEADFLKRFPKVRLDINTLYTEDGNILTAAGGTAGLDCCLYLVKKFYGTKTANQTARWIVFPPHRDGGQAQYIERPLPQTPSEERLRALLPWILENLETPHTIQGLSARLWMSQSSFNRHFKKLTGQNFKQWLIEKRLSYAQQLLHETTLSIDAIAYKTGYGRENSFREAFMKKFSLSPSKWRAKRQKNT